jgi:polysaccharide deacetylase family protein (PEP-CTERM system associated)
MTCIFTIDIEDWYHILDSPVTPSLKAWGEMESRLERNLNVLLDLLALYGQRATFFWLGWVAEQHKNLLLRCVNEGHEIGSHGYAHLLACKVGASLFAKDIQRAKFLLEDLTSQPVRGFRAPGFGITDQTRWAFSEIRKAGYEYDSSVFPANRAHGGMPCEGLEKHTIVTDCGSLVEVPMTVLEIFGKRICLFSGGYLRLAPLPLIRWGANRIEQKNRTLVVLVHPREIDPEQPRLDLGPVRCFKTYVNLHTTLRKIRYLLDRYDWHTMSEFVFDERRED